MEAKTNLQPHCLHLVPYVADQVPTNTQRGVRVLAAGFTLTACSEFLSPSPHSQPLSDSEGGFCGQLCPYCHA